MIDAGWPNTPFAAWSPTLPASVKTRADCEIEREVRPPRHAPTKRRRADGPPLTPSSRLQCPFAKTRDKCLKVGMLRYWQRICSVCEGVVHFAVQAAPLAPSGVDAA